MCLISAKHLIWTVLFQPTKIKALLVLHVLHNHIILVTPPGEVTHKNCIEKILFTHAKYMGRLIYKCPDEYRSTFRDAETNRAADNEGSAAKLIHQA